MDKRQIEQRIEEDRERHKRLKESVWEVGGGDDERDEFDRMWSETSSLNSDDFAQMKEDSELRKEAMQAEEDERNEA